jgi:hypothetical protein
MKEKRIKAKDIDEKIEIDCLIKTETSGWKQPIDLKKLKSIVSGKKKSESKQMIDIRKMNSISSGMRKKWMKAIERSNEVEIDV